MTKRSKRCKEIDELVDLNKTYKIEEAIELLKKCPTTKFDQSVDVSMKLGVDPKKADQQVRGTVLLPHGSGKKVVLLVFAKGDRAKEALDAGADYAGDEEYIQKVQGGWTDFNAVIATPDMMREVGKLGKVLGPRGLMPTPKAGTVTVDVVKAINEMKAGKIEFKVDKSSVVNQMIGKLSFDSTHLVENFQAFCQAVFKAKPASSKGAYVLSFFLSSTMGPGLKIVSDAMQGMKQ